VESIHVVLVDLNAMLSQIVKAILAEPDVRVTTESGHHPDIAMRIANSEPDVVIFATDEDTLPSIGRAVFDRWPRAKVLTIPGDAREAFLFELRPFRVALGQLSPEALLKAVRTARTAPV